MQNYECDRLGGSISDMNVTESVSANAKSGACYRVGLINEFDKRGLITYKSAWNLINLHLEDCCS